VLVSVITITTTPKPVPAEKNKDTGALAELSSAEID